MYTTNRNNRNNPINHSRNITNNKPGENLKYFTGQRGFTNSFKKLSCNLSFFLIVDTTLLINIRKLQIKPLYTGSYFPYPVKQLIEIIFAKMLALF